MDVYRGEASLKGIAIGRIVEAQKDSFEVSRTLVEDADEQIRRYHEVKEKTREELYELRDQCVGEIGEADAAVFGVYAMLLDGFDDHVETMIRELSVNAEYAVARTGEKIAAMFAAMEDNPYMQARQMDIKDVTRRLLLKMNSEAPVEESGSSYTEPVILIADDLAPSQTVQLDKNMVQAFVTRDGSPYSHTAILARTMNLLSLSRTPIPREAEGKMGIVDGFTGCIFVDPDEKTLARYRRHVAEELAKKQLLAELKGKETITKSGRRIRLYANISGIEDLDSVFENDAAGIGLFRSEFLYLRSDDFPSEEEQFEAYRTVAERMDGREVVIRTLDIGADKQIDYFELEKEENPALGCRAIRLCLMKEEIFRTQLRALYRASQYGSIRIIFPMIISVWEVETARRICEDVKRGLKEEGIPFHDVPLGIMIETPAAVLIADQLAEMADFFSIGTNDLTQYTLALDSRNQALAPFFNGRHPAVLDEIKMTVEAAHRHGIPVSICGELGADPELTESFIRMGVDGLSVNPAAVLPIRKIIRQME